MPTLTNTFAPVNPYISDLFFNTEHEDVRDVVQLDAEAADFLKDLRAFVVSIKGDVSLVPSGPALVQDFQARL